MRNYLVLGSWNVICDRCGFKFKSYMLQREWTGLMVCKDCWEARHPQTLIKVPREDIAPPWARPEPDDIFVGPGYPILTESEAYLSAEDNSLLITET